ncbi:MAG: winged helix-turn-helix domain-containing protein [Acidobacteriota bacterium]
MISAVQDEKIYEFGDFRLIPGENLLLHSSKKVALNPKAFAVLTLLVERHGHLVQKSEIIDQIWDGAFVEEGAISKSIWFVRSVLGDTSKERFIQTIPRRGYRFVAPVTVLNDPSIAALSTETISTAYRLPARAEDDGPDLEFISTKEQAAANGSVGVSDLGVRTLGRSGILRLSALILLLAAGASAAYMFYPWKTASSGGGSRSIAVLPFRPVDTANGGYENGFADALINRLSSTDGLIVRQLSAVRKYADLEMDPVAAGREQKVDYVLAPYYQMADGKIRITGQLIDLATGKTEQAFDFVKDISGVFAMQDAVADELRNKLAVKFGAGRGGPPTTRGTNNEEAYRLYQLAMALVAKSGPANRQVAIGYLDRAVALDPNYAHAWAGKAYAHAQDVWNPSGVPNREQIPKSLDAVQKALSIDPDLSEAHTVLCENRLFFEYDFDGAETACRRAVSLDPNSSVAHLAYSRFLNSRGRFDESFAEVKTAMDLDPTSFVIQRQYANVFFLSRRYPEAEEEFKRAISLNPEGNGPYERLILTLEAQGKESEAFDYLIRWYEIHPESRETIERLKAAYAASGWRGVLIELIRTTEAQKSPNYYALAGWYAALDNKGKAFENLEKAYQERNLNLAHIRVANYHFDSLRDDPRFADLLRRIEVK